MAQLERTQTPDDHASPSPSVSHLKTQKLAAFHSRPTKARKGTDLAKIVATSKRVAAFLDRSWPGFSLSSML